MQVVNALDLWSNIFYYRHWNSCHVTLYKQLFYYFKVINKTNTRNNDPIENNNNNNNGNNNDNSNNNDNDFNNNISKY